LAGGRVLLAAVSAIDIAQHNIKGKSFGMPIHELAGGSQRDAGRSFATCPGEVDPR
jgi:galactonate dehydratase